MLDTVKKNSYYYCMNKNTKARFNKAKKNKVKQIFASSFDVPKVLSGVGEHSTWGTYGLKTFHLKGMPRRSKKAKVAFSGKKTQTEIQQENEKRVAEIEIVKISKQSSVNE